ncbi:Calx-beta domain-containing protein [Jatrophihabitans sp. GAS493]|uniref:beta strand repeat-containing protein n=1 Tax=Jatrophihabitans sp. GAS493 TaxID=1907575 RepID=UPI000BB7EB2F|nr:Calx-beta domain-containing protein [Jatrophihabitans sp. GAS493]SOD74837.1 Calx-beta domain-containing protein [Jatrophihabitans sp. GAS493]
MSRHRSSRRSSKRFTRLSFLLTAVVALLLPLFAGTTPAGADSPVQVTVADTGVLKPTTGTTTVAFTIRLTHPSTNTVTVNWATADGTAIAGRDYTARTGVASFSPGVVSSVVTVTITGNAIASGNRYFNFQLTSASYGTIIRGTAYGTIIDDTPAPFVSVADTAANNATGAAGSITFTVTLSQASTNIVTVRYRTANGNARAGLEYTAQNGTLSFSPGTTSQVVSVALLGHVPPEQSWYLSLGLSSPTNATVLDGTGYGYITNPDRVAQAVVDNVGVSKPASGTSVVSVPVRLITASTVAATFDYYTSDGSAVAGTDYVGTRGTITFAAGVTSATIPVTINGNATTSTPKYFSVNINNPSAGAAVLANAYVTIVSPGASTPQIAVRAAGIIKPTSGTATMSFTITAQPAPTTALTMSYATSNSSAIAGTDYTATSGTATIAAGATSTTVTVPVLGNQIPTGDPFFYLNISNNSAGTLTNSYNKGVIEAAAASQQSPWLSVNTSSAILPSTGSATMNYTVTLSPASGSTATVQYATFNNSAVAGTDYTAQAGTLTFAPGETSKVISVPLIASKLPGADKSFGLTISSPTNSRIDTASAYGTIRNQNYPPVLAIGDASAYRSALGTATMTFPITLSAPSVNPVVVTYSTSNGSAVAGTDYTAASGTLTIPAGATTASVKVSIPKLAVYSAQLYFYLNISSATNALLSNNYGYGYIISNTVVPVVSVTDTAVVASAAATNAVFTIGLGAPNSNAVTVKYATSNGSAVSGTDYTATSGIATFAAGVTSLTVSVPVAANTVSVGSSYFYLSLNTPTNAYVGRATSTATILYQAVTPQLSVGDSTVTRQATGTKNATYTVTLSPASTTTVTVNYSTSNGSAVAGTDFTATSGTLTFAPGTTSQTVTVPITANASSTADRYYYFSLGSAVNASILRATGYGEIVDTVAPTSGLSYATVSDATVIAPVSGTTTATFTVSLLPAATSTVTMSYATADSSALAEHDYTPVRGTLTFTPGQTSKTVTVPVLAQQYASAPQSFTLGVSQTSGPVTLQRSYGYGVILDPQPGGVITSGADKSVVRGTSGSTTMTFKVSLIPAQLVPVTVDYRTVDESAIAGKDYAPITGSLTFAPGQTSATVSTTVKGDHTASATKYFGLLLENPSPVGVAPYSSYAYGYLDPIDTFSITGTVRDQAGAAVSGATVTRTGNNQPTVAVTTAADGTYSIPNAVSGSYTLTPSGLGRTYLPASVPVTVAGKSIGSQSIIGYTGVIIGGKISSAGAALAGATITRAGGGLPTVTVTSNSLGYYAVPATTAGAYTMTAALSGYAASAPASYTTNIAATAVTSDSFFLVKAPYITVKLVGPGGVEVTTATVTASGPITSTATTNVHGNYAFSALSAGTYTVTPTLSGKTFTPASAPATITATTGAQLTFTEN